jgi:hypothetical protein
MENVKHDLTFGQKAVGTRFNPSELTEVDELKELYAQLIDCNNNLRDNTDNPEKKRQFSIAITELQTAQMWTVKALTWQY